MSFKWTMEIGPLRYAKRTCRPTPPSWWAALLGRFCSRPWKFLFLVLLQMTHPASSIYLLLYNAPKVLYWAKLGHVGRVAIPFQGGHSGLLQELDSVTRVMCYCRDWTEEANGFVALGLRDAHHQGGAKHHGNYLCIKLYHRPLYTWTARRRYTEGIFPQSSPKERYL